jgi:hypothetical protein
MGALIRVPEYLFIPVVNTRRCLFIGVQIGQFPGISLVLAGVESSQIVECEPCFTGQDLLIDCFKDTALPKGFETPVCVLGIVPTRENK